MEGRQPRKLAVILHADVVGSTALVRKNESLAHACIQDAFRRFLSSIEAYNGVTHELRGDALVAEFARASDAVGLAVQIENNESNAYKRSFAIKVPAAGNQSGGGLRVATFFV
jgi:class 3 adenylate cyclase